MIRKFLHFAIDRPVLNHIFLLLLLLMAFFAYRDIPKEIFPPAQLDTIIIQGGYPGASADVLDKMAVHSLENGLKTIDDLSHIRSIIRNGVFVIRADIKHGSDDQVVLNNTKDIVSSIRKDLPHDMNPPIAKIVQYRSPLLSVAVYGQRSEQNILEITKELKNSLSHIPNMDAAQLTGDFQKEIHINIHTHKLEAYNIPPALFYQSMSEISSIYPAGTFHEDGHLRYLSTANGPQSAEELRQTLLTFRGKRIRVGDVADVVFGHGTPEALFHYNTHKGFSINLTKNSQGNSLLMSRQVKDMLDRFHQNYPDVMFQIYSDTSQWIRNRINLVTSNIFFGLILVFGAIFLTMNWRIASVVALGIPTSFFIGVIFAKMFGYSMNMLTMMGVLIALGMIVDEAIVVAENIFRHMEMGKPPKESAIEGTAEMVPAILTANATTVFSFLPLLITTGKMGLFVKVIPVMIAVLLLSSLFEAVYFLPLHSMEFFSFRHRIDHHKQSLFWDTLSSKYAQILHSLLERKKISLSGMILGIGAITLLLFFTTKFELFPPFDGTQIYINGQVDVHSKLPETELRIHDLEHALQKIYPKDVASITTTIGINANPDMSIERADNFFSILVNLYERKPVNFFDKYINPWLSLEYDESKMKRTHNVFVVANTINTLILQKYQNRSVFEKLTLFVPQTGLVKHDIEIGLLGKPDTILLPALNTLASIVHKITGVIDVETNADDGANELKLHINSYGERLGFTEDYLIENLRGIFLNMEYGKVFEAKGMQRLYLLDKYLKKDTDIRRITIRTPNGKHAVRIGDICTIEHRHQKFRYFHENGKKIWSLYASTDHKIILPSEVLERLRPYFSQLRRRGIRVQIRGEEAANAQVKSEMTQAGIIALFLIFISLVWMFNSWQEPLLVLSVVPLSISGAMIGTYLFGLNLSVIGIMGIVGLFGVVVNDGLIMIDFIRHTHYQHEIIAGAQIRLRPIILTSLTTVLGLFTIMFFSSGQAQIVQPMAVSLGFGVFWATILNLFYLPLVYAVVYKIPSAFPEKF